MCSNYQSIKPEQVRPDLGMALPSFDCASEVCPSHGGNGLSVPPPPWTCLLRLPAGRVGKKSCRAAMARPHPSARTDFFPRWRKVNSKVATMVTTPQPENKPLALLDALAVLSAMRVVFIPRAGTFKGT